MNGKAMNEKTDNFNNASNGAANEAKPRIFLVRHGQPMRHSGKIFLGQADPPLSELGKKEAARAGAEALRLGARANKIYASDLSRAMETATIIAHKLGDIPVIADKLFREMAMGTWDGELIEDIKAKFPEEYARRGSDLRNYRTPGGENFYDLRGRVTREFHRIFAEEFSAAPTNDIVIVAHLGVIIVLTEELFHADPADGNGHNFATGSVSVYDAPDWLFG